MGYYPDLSPYTYSPVDEQAGLTTRNIGWLVRSKPYPQGNTSQEFQHQLLKFCAETGVLMCLGYQLCPFCPKKTRERVVHVTYHQVEIPLGNGEIRVLGHDVVYAAPTLIYHYVVDHQYCPPEEFIEAVLTGPAPGSPQHLVLLQTLTAIAEDDVDIT